MEKWLVAGSWGLVSGLALVLGSLIGFYVKISQRTVAIIMGFGAGVLMSALWMAFLKQLQLVSA